MRKFLFIIPVILFSSCLNDDSLFTNPYEILFTAMLSEYTQEEEKLYSFSYRGWNLNTMTLHQEYGDLEFQFEYTEDKVPVKASGVYRERDFEYTFYYTDGLLTQLDQSVEGGLWKTFAFFYDDSTRIVKSEEITNGNLRIREFEWEAGNITKLLAYTPAQGKDFAQVYEFEYDDQDQPMRTAFFFIGYDLINDLPINLNNWTKLSLYNNLNPGVREEISVDFKYYPTGYPYENTIRYIDGFGDEQEVETSFMY